MLNIFAFYSQSYKNILYGATYFKAISLPRLVVKLNFLVIVLFTDNGPALNVL